MLGEDAIHHGECVMQPRQQVSADAVLLQRRQSEGFELALRGDNCHGAHQRTQDDFRVVIEEVELKKRKWTFLSFQVDSLPQTR